MKFFIATNNYVVKGTVREYLKKQFPMVEIFDVMKDEDFLYHLEGQDETFFLVEKFFLGLRIQEKMACLNVINKNIHFIFFETGLVCADGFGLRVRKLGASGFISNAENKDVLLPSITKILQGDKDFPEAVNYAVEHGEHLSTRATGELTDIEFDIAVMLAHGLTNKEIAYELSITPDCVRAHVYWIRKKIGYHNPEDYAEVYKQMVARVTGGWNGYQN